MRSDLVALLAVLLVASPVLVPGSAQPLPDLPEVPLGERVFVLVMNGMSFNGFTYPESPFLEAFDGERLTFVLHVPPTAEPHTFHVHGHPWLDVGSGRNIDTVLLMPGETHRFEVTAGLDDGRIGDWFYHCHMETHFMGGMWGLMRVHRFSVDVAPAADVWTLDVHHGGRPLDVRSIRLLDEVGTAQALPFEAGDGGRLAVRAPLLSDGTYRVEVETALGTSTARVGVTDGAARELRHVLPPEDVLEVAPGPLGRLVDDLVPRVPTA